MRILHVVHQYPPDHVGGTELYTQTLAGVQGRRDDVAVFVPEPIPPVYMLSMMMEHDLDVYRVPVGARSSTAVFRATFGHSRLSTAFGHVLDEFRPDVVHIEHLMGLPAGDMARELTGRGIPYVIALHDYWYSCANAQLLTNFDQTICAGPDAAARNCARCALARADLPGAAAPVIAPIMRRRNRLLADVFAGAALVIAPNEFVANKVRQLGLSTSRLIVLSWGMDLPDDLPAIRSEAAAARAAAPPGPLRLGYVGSLSPQKGIHVLVNAINALPDDSVTLDIYGSPAVFPEYVHDLQGRATHPGIQWRGLLSREDFWPRVAALDALVLPTLWYEASPLTIDEAFAAGTPVIASDIGAPAVMIRDGVDGRLFTPGDPVALADALRSLCESPETLATLRAGIRPVKTMESHAAEIDEWYRRLVRFGAR